MTPRPTTLKSSRQTSATMLSLLTTLLTLLPLTLSTPLPSTSAATVGKIRGVREPIYHLYLQSLPKSASTPVLGPESAADEFTIGGTIQSRKSSLYLNIQNATTSYKPLKWEAQASTTAWGLEGDTIITVQGSSYGRRRYRDFTSTDLLRGRDE
jgi:hypothetical protein